MDRCRFAPTPSGPAHPGTLLAALLCWLDARSRGAAIELRLEDVDHTRCTPENAEDLRAALAWFGLDWDSESLQSEHRAAQEHALDELAALDRLYPCACSRSTVRRTGLRAADGGFRYPGTCRAERLPTSGWRNCDRTLRLRLDPGRVAPVDEGGLDLAQDPSLEMGDPVLRRRDGAIAYHLAVVADDAAAGVTRVVRGRDLAASTAIQCLLQHHLDLATPAYHHHFLLLEERGGKFAKLHGAVGWREIKAHMSAGELCAFLARVAGIRDSDTAVTPAELVTAFDWQRVARHDAVVRFGDGALEILARRPAESPTAPS